jgi:tetratricopeptide (TPR) repeat protein
MMSINDGSRRGRDRLGLVPPPSDEVASPSESANASSERSLRASGSDRVYQAAGNQYICEQPASAPPAVRNTLPRDAVALTGRDAELQALFDRVIGALDAGATLPVQTIDGMPGVGKTAFAVHAGHRLAPRFPDGQFFVDLHGHSPGQASALPTDALFALLCEDGVDPERIPVDVDSRAALWRGRVAGRRILLILDNAAGRGQVEQLLPGAAGSLVLITSRRRLSGLSARCAAETLSLDTLAPDDAAMLFATMSARSATGPDRDAIRELVLLCGYLPLAICLLAARLRPEPSWSIADLLGELKRSTCRLAQMRAEDLAVAAAFDLSYCHLPAARRRFFRRLGLHPGADIGPAAAGALNAIAPATARRHLDALYHDHLLDQPAIGRYRMHDLIGHYARDRAEADPTVERDAAVARLLDHYQHGAQAVARHLWRPGRRGRFTEPTAGDLPDFRSRRHALAWMDVERANLFACAGTAAVRCRPDRLIGLATAMAPYLRSNGPWNDAASLYQAAVSAAEQAGNRESQAQFLLEMGLTLRSTGDYPAATETLNRAAELYRELEHRVGETDAQTELAGVRWRVGDHDGAARELEYTLARYQDLGDRHGQAHALDELGLTRELAGDRAGAVDALRQALAIHRELGDLQGQANVLNRLGLIEQLAGDFPSAVESHEQALAIIVELGDRHDQARVLNLLGTARCDTGDFSGAKEALRQALQIHAELGYRAGQANALNYLGIVHRHEGDHPAAERALREALDLYRALGNQPGCADALNQLGILARLDGRYDAAAEAHDSALTIFRDLRDNLGQSEVLNALGSLWLDRADPVQALRRHRDALRLSRQAGNPLAEARAIEGIARCAMQQGDVGTAIKRFREAQAILRRIGALVAAREVTELVDRVAA